MRRRIASLVGLLAAGLVIVSCGQDARQGALPTGPVTPGSSRSDAAPGTCTTLSNLNALANAAFGAGSPNASSVLGKIDNLDKQLRKGNIAGAQDQARLIVSFVQAKAEQGTLPGTHAQIQALISGVLCYAGLSPDTFLILPTDNAQVLRSGNGHAGISLQANTVNEPTLVTITFLADSAPPLITKLDQYPGFIVLTQSSPLTKPAVVGVCPASGIPSDVLERLRLGHQASTGFEITPDADASFLDCSTSTAQATGFTGLLQRLASFVTPKPLYAATLRAGGIGGLVSEFSPFGPVDPEVSMRSGIGGLVSVVNGACTQIDAVAGDSVQTACRPVVTLQTFRGTILESVPVNWAIGVGGGVIAPEVTSTHACSTFGSTASTTTNADGKASVCWTLGPIPGTNTVVATPAFGGDIPAGVTFSPANLTFTAIATAITPIVTATGGVFVYDGLPHVGSGTCSNGLTPALSYSPNVTVPTNAGTYTLSVTCGAGNPLYVTVTQTATIQINQAATTASISCPASVTYTGSPITPCSGGVTGPGLSQSITPTYVSNILGTATATVSYSGSLNYLPSSVSKTFKVLYVQSGCFASPIYSVMPPTKSSQNKGSNLPLKCTLLTAQGAGVTSAHGDLLVQDMGTDGTASPITVVSVANAFTASSSGNYSYGLDTSPAGFRSKHYYLVTATWSDGSTTTGWFYIK